VGPPELLARLTQLTQPAAAEVRLAKRAVMRRFGDGAAHATAALAMAVAEDLGAPREMVLELRFSGQIDATAIQAIQAEDAVVSFIRKRLAARRAVADLAAYQLLMPAMNAEGESTHDPLAKSPLTITIHHPHGSFGASIRTTHPGLAAAYMLSPLAEAEPKWFLDPDLFLEGLAALPLDARAQRTLREALTAFRRGLYLASLALLGVVSEATWYAAARKLGNPGSALERAVNDGATATVQKRVADILRTVPDWGRPLTKYTHWQRCSENSGTTGCMLSRSAMTLSASSQKKSAAS
jgi:hypothetical protein